MWLSCLCLPSLLGVSSWRPGQAPGKAPGSGQGLHGGQAVRDGQSGLRTRVWFRQNQEVCNGECRGC